MHTASWNWYGNVVMTACLWSCFACGASSENHSVPRSANVPMCITDPSDLAMKILNAARTKPADELLAAYGMSKDQFARFTGVNQMGDVTDAYAALQRDELQRSQKSVAHCNGVVNAEMDVRTKDSSGIKVYAEMQCADGTTERQKVKLIRFEGCLYLGAID